MCSSDFPDISALALGHCAPSFLYVHVEQITPAHVAYITCPFLPEGWHHAFFVPYAIKQSPPLVFLDPMRCHTVQL